jgi:hypothetical protein
MRRTHSTIATVIAIGFLVGINLIAFNWTSKFFHEQLGTAFIRYGDRIPKLEGPGYFGGKRLSVDQSKANLIIYLSQADLKGQSISLLKFCETLEKGERFSFKQPSSPRVWPLTWSSCLRTS